MSWQYVFGNMSLEICCRQAMLLGPILRDVKVYGEARRINNGKGNNMVVNCYRDRQRIYFGCYDPKESVQRWTYLEDAAVNRLLAPNSMERGNHSCYTRCYSLLITVTHCESLTLAASSLTPPPFTSFPTAAPKPRPENATELYKRLVGMLHLERPRGSIMERKGTASTGAGAPALKPMALISFLLSLLSPSSSLSSFLPQMGHRSIW